ncbi:hypothetical protein X801_03054 [Opisthorchis viverrini]|uniref:Uncharacterized protein n=2 Tax=Opisthorchis viverrini TaxID=6198 RepID=A0A1S8X2Z5_OPIVI|nr:hypothetical protein T265_07421 [Opisthorchis viverrini]KER25025.1 hypothetical protein T265_07421 [Opisthorchis viverrini]OON21056.1 hypothetical protein X801_03054 [Opisthorchis viverrini]
MLCVDETQLAQDLTTYEPRPNLTKNPFQIDMKDNIHVKPTSTKGYTLGARTAKRESRVLQDAFAPGPGTYDPHETKKPIKMCFLPFNQASGRVTQTITGSDVPGVGTYNLRTSNCRRIPWQRDTMLRPIDLPQVEQKSTIPVNTNKLPTTTECKRYQRKLAYLQLYF